MAKSTTLMWGDSILAHLREDKLYKIGSAKTSSFHRAKIKDLYYHLIP